MSVHSFCGTDSQCWIATALPGFPAYADKCHGEGFMHDTAMLMGAMGGDRYEAPAEVITPYFASSGTGQINAIFPVTPLTS